MDHRELGAIHGRTPLSPIRLRKNENAPYLWCAPGQLLPSGTPLFSFRVDSALADFPTCFPMYLPYSTLSESPFALLLIAPPARLVRSGFRLFRIPAWRTRPVGVDHE